ncbi:MAG: hypothetical protein MSC31_14690 [Solirubrobacteraceae bacterium MAG38_C4-C5]|nr:hypothetical protein [Candidatus Siliceabacter maunaloa]
MCPTTDWSDVVDRLDLLISAVERVADASESMKADLRDIEDNMSSLRFDVASIEADVTLIQLAMP